MHLFATHATLWVMVLSASAMMSLAGSLAFLVTGGNWFIAVFVAFAVGAPLGAIVGVAVRYGR